jgi:hypothetical protein
MPSTPDIDFRLLAEPFAESEVKWRVQSSGKKQDDSPWVRVLPYIDNAAVMKRLDEVVGIGRWANRFEEFEGGIICGLSILIDGQWVTKWDGAPATQTEPFKGALSGAQKRAAVQWGIGRYLHGVGEQYAVITTDRNAKWLKADPQKHGAALHWNPPKLPAHLVKRSPSSPPAQAAQSALRETLDRVAPKPAAPAAPAGNMASAVAAVAGVAPAKAYLNPMTKRTVAARDLPLPGTKAHLDGHGGKTLGEVPVRDLPAIRAALASRGSYAPQVEAIDEILAQEMGGGA